MLDENRRAFEAHQQTVALLAGVERHAPSSSFTEEVLAGLPDRRSRPWDKVWELLWAPRVARWNVATALALSLVLVVTALAWRAQPSRTAVGPEPRPVVTLFRFSLNAPGAQQVSLAGDFNGWRFASSNGCSSTPPLAPKRPPSLARGSPRPEGRPLVPRPPTGRSRRAMGAMRSPGAVACAVS
jgi:hypothetical protein